MKLQKMLLATAIAAILPAQAIADVSANIGVTSNYMWRGMEQGTGAAVSGGLDFEGDTGWFSGIWTSNVDFGDGAGNETDFYGGYSGSTGALDFTISGAYYSYSEYEDTDFAEVLVDLSYAGLDFGLAYTLIADFDDAEGDLYYYVGKSFELSSDVSAGVTFGMYSADEATYDDHAFAQLDISKGDFTLSAIKANDTVVSDDVKFVVS